MLLSLLLRVIFRMDGLHAVAVIILSKVTINNILSNILFVFKKLDFSFESINNLEVKN